MDSRERSAAFRYGIAAAGLVAVVLVRWLLDPVLGNYRPYVTVFPAVVLAVWFGGWRAAAVTTVAGFAAVTYLFIPPRGSLVLVGPVNWVGTLAYFCSSSVIIALGEAMHRARRRAELGQRETLLKQQALEAEVRERQEAERESAALKDRLAMELADMTRLHELGDRLLKQNELKPLLHEVLEASMELLHAEKGNIQLYDEREKALKIVTHAGFSEKFLARFAAVKKGWSVCGTAMEKRERVIVEDAFSDPHFKHEAEEFASHGFAALQSTPLFSAEGNLIGMLSTHFSKPHRPGHRELRLLDLYAQQAERVIERKQAEDRLRQLFDLSQEVNHARDIASIYESALDIVIMSLQANRASILLYDSDGIMRFKAWRGLSEVYRRAVEGHSPWQPGERAPKPVCIEDVAAVPLEGDLREVIRKEGIQGLLFIPLVYNSRLLGKFMAYYDEPHRFTKKELQLAQTIAGQLAFAIERKRSEEALRESEARLRTAVDASNMGVWEWDMIRDRVNWSERMFEFYGVEPKQFDGTVDGFLGFVHPEDREAILEALRRAVELRQPYGMEFRSVQPDGRVRWLKTAGRVIFDEQGAPIRMLGGTIDLTERKQMEQKLQWQAKHLDQLVQEQTAKLRETVMELESFSYTIAHDMRAPLRAMHGFAQLLESGYSENLTPDGRDCIRRIVSSARRMDHLIQDVLSYSRIARTDLKPRVVDVRQLVIDVLETYPAFQEPKAVMRIEGELPAVLGNEALLTQCFSNLLENAVKFVPPGTIPRVTIRAERAGSRARFFVEDNGIGISVDFQEQIFGVFQRLNQSYEGTGIGLAIVRRAAERMGGSVGLYSELGNGSRFWIELPCADSSDPNGVQTRDELAAALETGGGGRVTERDSLLSQRSSD